MLMDMYKDLGALTFRVNIGSLDCLTLEDKVSTFFRNVGNHNVLSQNV
jgi:hypothetical protein